MESDRGRQPDLGDGRIDDALAIAFGSATPRPVTESVIREIEARCGIGACTLRMPRDVGVRLESAGVMIGESNVSALRNWPDPEPGSPTLTLSLTGKMGEVLIQR